MIENIIYYYSISYKYSMKIDNFYERNKHCKYFNCNKTEIDSIWRNIFFDHVNGVIRYFTNQNTRLLIYDIEIVL